VQAHCARPGLRLAAMRDDRVPSRARKVGNESWAIMLVGGGGGVLGGINQSEADIACVGRVGQTGASEPKEQLFM